jgi:hypothetical protein
LVTTLHTANIVVKHEKYGYRHIEKLTEIINPIVWQRKIDAIIYSHRLISGLRSRKNDNLTRYVSWAIRTNKYSPRVKTYSNILLCLQILNQKNKYFNQLSEAKNTYPQIQDWENEHLKSINKKTEQ